MLDWVKEWNTGKTLINGNTVITPKLFAGTKNSDGTVSGIAIGSFTLNTKTSSGTIAAEAVNGIYGFRDGYKTFYVDNGGNAQLGYGDQYVRYNATTGKVEFGSGVSLNWSVRPTSTRTASLPEHSRPIRLRRFPSVLPRSHRGLSLRHASTRRR